MRHELKVREMLGVLCAKSVGMTYGGNLHRGREYSRLY
jgi:hypothetical protein